MAAALERNGLKLHPEDVHAVFAYAADDPYPDSSSSTSRTEAIPYSLLLSRLANDPADQAITRAQHTNTLNVAPNDAQRKEASRRNEREAMLSAHSEVLPPMGLDRADELLRHRYLAKGQHLRNAFLRLCRGRGPLVTKDDLRQALQEFGLRFHKEDYRRLLDFYFDLCAKARVPPGQAAGAAATATSTTMTSTTRRAVVGAGGRGVGNNGASMAVSAAAASAAASAAARMSPRGTRVDYHLFLDALSREVQAAQPLFGEMFDNDARIEASRNGGPDAKAKARVQVSE